MAISLNSIVALNSTFQAKSHHFSRYSINASTSKLTQLASSFWVYGLRRPLKKRSLILPCSIADSDCLATENGDTGTADATKFVSDSTVKPSSSDSLGQSGQIQTSVGDKSGSQTSDALNGSIVSSDLKQEVVQSPNLQSTAKRSPLTARERLRAARVLSRYNETKLSKSAMGNKVLDALTESEKGKKRSGLPEAPTNLFDDRDRGLPKQGLTFQFPGGMDLFIIAFSFVFISTVMFTTTYIVWKVGAIHFNEY
ncbi:uncharacterized protein LOC110819393 [Carica papaya]|uniref:uncharacterized protein LOC110819393 n=1 Tax=Carica papaya TaxID=3649 RepID=UPI000B8D0FBE|nr:uncharacterized protein LOC110819393 [Carica papaya]